MDVGFENELKEAFASLLPSVQKARAEGRMETPGVTARPDPHAAMVAAFEEFLSTPLRCSGLVEPEPEPEPDPVLLVQLEACLQMHDWHYDFSDSAQTWRAGKESEARIERLADLCGPAGARLLQEWRTRKYG